MAQTVSYTPAEFGHMAQIVELLAKTKTKREHKALITDISRFMKSMSRLADKYKVPAEFEILSIRKVLRTSEFPSTYHYTILFVGEDNVQT